MKRILFLVCISFFTFINTIDAQDPVFLNQELIRAELDKRGFQDISFEEMEQRLTAKGIDVQNLDPSQMEVVQTALDEIYLEISQEKANAQEPTEAEKKMEDQKEKVEEFADKKEDEALDDEVEDDVYDLTDAEKKAMIYGQDLFLDLKLSSYKRNANSRPPQSYILGEDDEIIINIIGNLSQFNGSFLIQDGYIKPTGMEAIFLKGLSFGQASKLLESKFAKYYRFKKADFTVALNNVRDIIVNVTGMARNFGSYEIPATNTAFTALVAAKGPSVNGSVRNIMIHRSGSPSKNFDLYEYMLDPSVADNFFLQNNDYVHIPTKGKVITLDGAVIRPHKYELKDNENLKKLLTWAGGLQGNAYKKSIRIIRFEDDEEKIITVNYNDLEKSGRDFQLKNGDKVNIPSIPVTYRNFVIIEGEVDLPGEYQLNTGMKIRDLVLQGNPSDLAKMDEAFLFRKTVGSISEPITINLQEILTNPNSPNNLTLQAKDRIYIFSEDEFAIKNSSIKLTGAVRNPNVYAYAENIKISSLITLSGGLTQDATGLAYIYRSNRDSFEPTEYIRVDVAEAMNNRNGASDVILEARDSIAVFSYSELIDKPATVSIKGAVLSQNEFSYSTNMTLRDLLSLSGGLKISADQTKINIYRINIKSGEATKTEEIEVEIDDNMNVLGAQDGEFYLNPYDIVDVRYTPDFELQQNVVIKGEVKYPGSYSIIKPNEKLSEILKRAGGFKETALKEGITLLRQEGSLGYLVVDVNDVLTDVNSPSNYILKDGDVITIPKEVNVVSIMGYTNAAENYGTVDSMNTKVNVPFSEGKDARFYIDKYAGGVNREEGGKYKMIKVRQPGGKLEKTKDYGFFKKYPKVQKGGVIIVEAKIEKQEDVERKKVDWGEVISNTVAQATAILTLVILIQQIQ